jgi:hypothetical protein
VQTVSEREGELGIASAGLHLARGDFDEPGQKQDQEQPAVVPTNRACVPAYKKTPKPASLGLAPQQAQMFGPGASTPARGGRIRVFEDQLRAGGGFLGS